MPVSDWHRPSQPLGFWEVLDRVAGLFVHGLPTFIVLGLLAFVPAAVAALAAGFGAVEASNSSLTLVLKALEHGQLSHGVPALVTGGIAIGVVVWLVSTVLAAGAAVDAAAHMYTGDTARAWPSVVSAARRFWPLLGALVVMCLLYLVGAVLLVVPAMLLVGYLAVVLPAIMLGDAGALSGIRTSFLLVHRMWWRAFGVLIVLGIAVEILSILAGAIPTAFSGSLTGQEVSSFVDAGATVVLFGVPYCAAVVLYEDLLVRRGAATSPAGPGPSGRT